MSESPIISIEGTVTVQIKSGGKPIPDTMALLSAQTDIEFNRVPKAILKFSDGDPASQEFPVTDGEVFKPGSKIEVLAGYGEGQVKQIFSGIVTENRLRMSGVTRAQIEVTCLDEVFKLTLGRKSRVFEDKKDSDILANIARESGITLSMDATTETFTELVQYQCSDWDFIVARTELNGMLVAAIDGEISVSPPDFSANTALTVSYGVDAVSFDGKIDARSQFKSVSAHGWSSDKQETGTAEAGLNSSNSIGKLTGNDLASVGDQKAFLVDGHFDVPDLKGVAKARQARAELARLIGTIRFDGNAKAKLGETLELKGFGKRFSGTGLISRVSHYIEDGNWRTEAQLGLDADWITDLAGIEAPGAAGLTVPIRGLHIGKVTKLTEESTSQKLLQVRIPILGEKAAPIWCRFGTPYATDKSGFMFFPEIDDEVVVGFFNDDPSNGVVIGALHSSKRQPPFDSEDVNNTKAIVTREQLKVTFDEEKKSITLETPSANTIVIDDDSKSIKIEDEHSNSIVLSSSGIVLDSPKDIKINAGGKVEIAAKSDVVMSGANINAKAQTAFSAVGTASAEVKASGTLTIQGAMVKIN